MINLADSSRLLFTDESMGETESMPLQRRAASYDELSRFDVVAIWYPRVIGFITLISAMIMLSMAWTRRKFVFHRLVLAMATHQVIYGLMYLLGTIMIPREYDEYYGNFGTQGTCTFQGFLIYVSTRSAAIYYGGFSIYSCVAVLNDFDRKRYRWCEKLIHILVHSYTLSTGIYGLIVAGYNPVKAHCKMASYPIDCETSDEVECERGPASFGRMKAALLWMAPLTLFLITPTFIMIFLFFKVKKREIDSTLKNCLITPKEVAIQSCVYLAPLYLAGLPFFISVTMEYFLGLDDDNLTPFTLAAQIMYTLFAFWSMLSYWYFSIDLPHNKQNATIQSKNEANSKKREHRETQLIFHADATRSASRISGVSDSPTTKTDAQVPSGAETEPTEERRYSFNIFDGTNACGAFSEFIHDGDSEDERLEKEETDRWNAVQDHI